MGGQMTFVDFVQAADSGALPPAGLNPALQALGLERRGKWDEAHELAQVAGIPDGAWVHAYLHRKEGDEENAAYWYRLAGRPVAQGDLNDEWERIVRALLGSEG